MLKLEIGMPIKSMALRPMPSSRSCGLTTGAGRRLWQLSKPYQNHLGFTLIEMLIVVLIISITIGVAVISFGDFSEKRQVMTAAEAFQQYVLLVKQEAILESSTLGIRIQEQGYDVLKFQEPNTWLTMKTTVLPRLHTPSKIIFHLLKPATRAKNPQIIVQASGELTPFDLQIGTTQKPDLVLMQGKINGAIVMTFKP